MLHECPECNLLRYVCNEDTVEFDEEHECDIRYCCQCGFDYAADGVETSKVS